LAVSIFFSGRIIPFVREHRGAVPISQRHQLSIVSNDAECEVVRVLFGAVVSGPQPRTEALVAVETVKAMAPMFAGI
jgi:hypothetical protein